ncbi:MAG: hypothetical protein R3Y43_02875 [Alphaproteobacteria bacterium]
MKILLLLIICFISTNSYAQFSADFLITDEIRQQEENEIKKEEQKQKMNKAIEDARALSETKLKKIKIDSDAFYKDKPKPKPKPKKKKILTIEPSPAPFGLLWGASAEEIEADMGVNLKRYNLPENDNAFEASLLPKPLKDFGKVVIVFGDTDNLWRTIAYQDTFLDEADAPKLLKEYKNYYTLLKRKYGSDKETYIPAKKIVITKVKKEEIKTEVEEEIGNPEFLKQLKSGEAVLYATFENDEIAVVLSANVNDNNEAYLVIDYKNIKVIEEKEKLILNTL